MFKAINDFIWSVWCLIPILLIVGMYFTISTKFVQFRFFKDMIKSMFSSSKTSKDANAISSFEAFAVGLASRVGTGNLAGVAIAIATGGPGAIFWMWIVALLGSASAFVESTIAQLYKVKDPETKFRGGPAYYIRDGLNSKTLGGIFAVLISIAFGLAFNSVQSNTISSAFVSVLNVSPDMISTVEITIGVLLVVVTGSVLFLGAHAIAKTTKLIVPFMAGLYLIIAFVIIIINFEEIGNVFSMIINGAFNPQSMFWGGSIGLINGVKRGLFSNEAGMGSAPNAAATADAAHPVSQGLIQCLGVFIDTIVICSATGFIILVSGVNIEGAIDGIELTLSATSSVLGMWSNYIMLIAIFFFAFSSILGNYYYSQSNIEYLSNTKISVICFKIVVLLFIFSGAVVETQFVWWFADFAMGLMALVNIYAIVRLFKYAKLLLNDYSTKRKTQDVGEVYFDSSMYEETKHFEIWNKSK